AIHEQMPSPKSHRRRGERAGRFARIHGRESVSTKQGKTGGAAGVHVAAESGRNPRPPAKLKVQLIPDDQTNPAGGMQITPIPVARMLRAGEKWRAVRTVPVDT